ncbi:MAG TPA: cobalamin biosynthesis protein CobD [Actinobacteria bacterium]|nr:cobalamin biosynthesis protein CobD [Actinomycetota bacterium]
MMVLVSAAFFLDLILGDPLWMPHPVRLVGGFIEIAEGLLRRFFKGRLEYVGGFILAISVVLITCLSALLLLKLAFRVSFWSGATLSLFLIFTCLATKGLAVEAKGVYGALTSGKLAEARCLVSRMVGRDTDHMDEREVARATVESVAENIVDGVVAPLFYVFLGGPVLVLTYKAVNTLDSMVGYKNDKYTKFGWFSAKLDDIANYLPARVTGFLFPLTSLLMGEDFRGCVEVLLRDRRKHPSPNAGIPESAMAGALGVRLGGLNFYNGKASFRPYLGGGGRESLPGDIMRAIRLHYALSITVLILGLAIFFAGRWWG